MNKFFQVIFGLSLLSPLLPPPSLAALPNGTSTNTWNATPGSASPRVGRNQLCFTSTSSPAKTPNQPGPNTNPPPTGSTCTNYILWTTGFGTSNVNLVPSYSATSLYVASLEIPYNSSGNVTLADWAGPTKKPPLELANPSKYDPSKDLDCEIVPTGTNKPLCPYYFVAGTTDVNRVTTYYPPYYYPYVNLAYGAPGGVSDFGREYEHVGISPINFKCSPTCPPAPAGQINAMIGKDQIIGSNQNDRISVGKQYYDVVTGLSLYNQGYPPFYQGTIKSNNGQDKLFLWDINRSDVFFRNVYTGDGNDELQNSTDYYNVPKVGDFYPTAYIKYLFMEEGGDTFWWGNSYVYRGDLGSGTNYIREATPNRVKIGQNIPYEPSLSQFNWNINSGSVGATQDHFISKKFCVFARKTGVNNGTTELIVMTLTNNSVDTITKKPFDCNQTGLGESYSITEKVVPGKADDTDSSNPQSKIGNVSMTGTNLATNKVEVSYPALAGLRLILINVPGAPVPATKESFLAQPEYATCTKTTPTVNNYHAVTKVVCP